MKNELYQIRGGLFVAWIMVLAIITPANAQSNRTTDLRLNTQNILSDSKGFISDATLTTFNFPNAIIDRVADGADALISTKGNMTGVYCADYFEISGSLDLGDIRFYGSPSSPTTFPSTVTGFNVLIYEHSGTTPDSDPENLGTGVLELIDINPTDFQLSGGVFTINVTQANGGQAVRLPAGNYWISAFPSVSTAPTDDGRWNWIGSASASPMYEPVLIDPSDLFGEGATSWTTVSSLIDESFPSFAWTMTQEGDTLPDCVFSITYEVEPITKVMFAGIVNPSSVTSIVPLEDFTDIEGEVEQGESYIIELEGYTDGSFTNYFTVWIDWNQDGSWDSSVNSNEMYEIGSISNSTGVDGVKATATINVPQGAEVGTTTMRIVKNYNTSPQDPCSTYGYGQAEDYTIIVGASENFCETVTDIEITAITETDATVNWTASATATEGYIVDVYEAGADSDTATTVFTETLVADVTTVEVTGLTPETDYDVYITSKCENDTSITSTAITFTTAPIVGVEDFNFNKLTVSPNPVTSDLNIIASKIIEEIQVYNILGQRVLKVIPSSLETTIDVNDLSSGTYILKVNTGGIVHTRKFIKR